MKRFILDGQYGKLLSGFGIKIEEALRKSELAEDIFSHKTPSMTGAEYYRFMEAVGNQVTDSETLIKIACADNIETFSPPVFASYCSKNGMICIKRLGRYKALMGPMRFLIIEEGECVSVEIATKEEEEFLPPFLVKVEMAFLINMLRKATGEKINPVVIKMQKPVIDSAYQEFCGCKVLQGEQNRIVYRRADLEIPFITQNDAMWDYFEPELKRRLTELEVDDTFSARVRSALTELLPGGGSSIEDVAKKLGISRRTLQRRLQEENTSFQKQLNHTRELLALHYIQNLDMNSNDIAYLLGYQELNSFLRAFSIWTGKSISEYRKEMLHEDNIERRSRKPTGGNHHLSQDG